MLPHRPSQSAEMLRRILVESSIKQEVTAGDRTGHQVAVESVDGPIDEVTAAGRGGSSIGGGYSWDSVIADAMLSTAAVHQAAGFRRQYMLAGTSVSALGADSDSEVAHELALSPHSLEEDVKYEADQSGVLGLNIDHDSSGSDLLAKYPVGIFSMLGRKQARHAENGM